MQTNQDNNLRFTLINSQKYFAKRIAGSVIIGLDTLLAGAVASRGASRSFLSWILDIPYGLEVALYVVVFILLVVGSLLVANQEDSKGEVRISKERILMEDVVYELKSISLKISLNAVPDKNIYKRTIKDQGGNNWIEIAYDGTRRRVEFLIRSLDDENKLKSMIEYYQLNKNRVTLKESPISLINKWKE
ncbi:hypothetical protein [Prolixibacter denitrificans]|uniref:Uncharacterized protein n=1 Tax=Prolixibacter denitrificans TaxID=1541063 RepID=A0A2P8CDU3_9BACT|nr:hypothetical protein [Prolixibacter denitrificans]PSK83116.1 hypothetical protein CLV93_10446 [Prolixibacter denitrificans]GET22001.1 hypothetical protein JCM18694_22470 [Prolixibacter denitrificans]